MKYREYKNLNLIKIGEEVLHYWNENKIFELSLKQREGYPFFTFYEGPPSANGVPGIHHVMARTIKDIFCRYKTLKGYYVRRKGGWDTHGLPVELQVEKELGINKSEIGKDKKISIVDYNRKCSEAVMRYTSQWETLTEKMGFWIDMQNPYITFDKKYIESVWHLLKRLYNKNLLYKGYTIQPYSPMAGTGLSSHELSQTGCYRNVKDVSVVAQFKILGSTNDYFLAWTTTPWTLPSNMALVVGKNITYIKIKTFNPYTYKPINVILAKDLLERYFSHKQKNVPFENYQPGDKPIPYKVIEEYKGKDLIGMRYHQLLDYVKPKGKAFYVIAGDFVSTEEGTGIVHAAPTFGADDLKACSKENILGLTVRNEQNEEMPLVDKSGRFVKEVTDFAGKYVKAEYESKETLANSNYKSTDVLIVIKLKKENKAFKVEKYQHSYPHCWRTDKPILYYPLHSWFVKTTAYKEKMIELNKTINWKPAMTGTGRFGNWLENLVDWNLSRSRFWGTPLPIWRTKDGKEEKCIGSLKELNQEVKKSVRAGIMSKDYPYLENGSLSEEFDLHRPFVDEIILVSDDGKPMYRELDLIDVWFDSGAMPFAQWHYPFENEKNFLNSFPADYIAEGVDQTRGWFFTLHAIAVMLEDSVAFKNVISNGLVLDKEGNKMSKRLGNSIDPFTTINTYSIDVVRWYMVENASPWDNLKFDIAGLKEVKRKFFGTLYNTYAFFALYANIDNFNYTEEEILLQERTEIDRWIISRLNTLIYLVEKEYDNYEPKKVARAIQRFVIDDLSNWYIRLNRKRFWKGGYQKDKIAAYQTLHTCLVNIAKLIAPISPFYAERLYRDLNIVSKKYPIDSVHLTFFPKWDSKVINKELEDCMKLAQRISSLVHSLRKKEKIKVRQPLSKILIVTSDTKLIQQINTVLSIISSEVNVKSVEFLKGESKEIFTRKINIPSDITTTFDDISSWSIVEDKELIVALDIKLTDELQEEGIAREIINKIQNIRKDIRLDVQDKIHINIKKTNPFLNQSLQKYTDHICRETQSLSLELVNHLENPTEIVIDNQELFLSIEKIKS